MTSFQRARSEEQRAVRREAILETAAAMLAEMPVAELSLNELSRRVGLAKSNVLNYFESREAVLLELLDTQMRDWTRQLEDALAVPAAGDSVAGESIDERVDRLAGTVVATLASRPMFCALVSAQASVLEHNISTDVALRFKRAAVADFRDLVRVLLGTLPELGEAGAERFIAAASMLTGAIWTHANPAPAILAVYDQDPELAALRMEFAADLQEVLEIHLRGLLAGRA
ncbi:TetR/AcrR family transcriptional regulator [Kribbella sp. VKM Ac-2568]|uniref:TetR/AcrR family transcriptional regulator n=1 Tax=Kribbella sp. VKM Ac-2568 TaxID=2512219 RepID=UPI0010528BBB|nr:TetR family transcriptional regulator [Kribbella sp. VKM Ac-2568]TCM38576.1 TetR family transcriptional regulator [Kribbella sp. VKM Ac-2568]